MKGRPSVLIVLVATYALVTMGAAGCGGSDEGGGGGSGGQASHQQKPAPKPKPKPTPEPKPKPKPTTTTTQQPPPTTTTQEPTTTTQADCTPGYSPCLRPASDYDCEGGTGDGPEYTGQVQVTGSDPYDLDSDSDGVGCE